VKRRDLERQLKELGWYFLRSGGSHDIWTNGFEKTQIPRHAEVNEYTAKSILKKAGQFQGKKGQGRS
jgi:mRNA interferase HicA